MTHAIFKAEATRHESIWVRFVESLSRVTSGGKFVPCVDGLRFIAILAVVLYHINGYLIAKASGFFVADSQDTLVFELLHGAQCGVQLFFAISGFILALPFAREAFGSGRKVSLKHYYFRRITRLEPPFLINLAIGLFLIVVFSDQLLSQLPGPLLATMTYTHNWIYGAMSTVNAVTWSLEIEIQFYIMAPFLARFYFKSKLQKRRQALAICVGALIMAKTLLVVGDTVRFRLGLLYALDHFLAGVLMADLFVFNWHEVPQRRRSFDLLCVAVLPAMFFSQLSESTRHLLPVLSALLFTTALRGPVANRLLSIPLIVVTGGMCYSIYLYHFFVISLVGRFATPLIAGHGYFLQLAMLTAIAMPAILVVCAFFFVSVEKPFMKWRPLRETTGSRQSGRMGLNSRTQQTEVPAVNKAA